MKKYLYLILATLLLLVSCNDEEPIGVPNNNIRINSRNIVKIPSKSLLYDEIIEVRDGKIIDLTNSQNRTRATSSHEFYEIASVNNNYIYTGSVMNATSINTGVYKPVGFPNIYKKLVTISFSLPVNSMQIAPKKSSLQDALVRALGDKDFTGKQSQIFTYKMKEFSYYNEMKLAFGANVNIGNFFNVNLQYNNGKIQNRSAMFIDFSQTYFSVDMDIPDDGNIFIDEANRSKYLSQNPVYVNTVNYGRKGIIMVESSDTYREMSLIIKAALTAGIVNGELNLDKSTKEKLTNMDIQICIFGGDGGAATKTVAGFHEFQNFIISGGVYTNEIYGTPISFAAAYASDNSMFVTEFQIEN